MGAQSPPSRLSRMTSCSLVNRRRSLAWFSGWLSKLIRSDAVFDCCKLCPRCKQVLYLVTVAAPALFAKRFCDFLTTSFLRRSKEPLCLKDCFNRCICWCFSELRCSCSGPKTFGGWEKD